jgi:molybdenum cofactor sulfurtransferase
MTTTPGFEVKSIVVFPIKSCQGFTIPRNKTWAMTAKGLAWDREWCLVNRATNRIMNQKRYPRMALLRPHLNIEENIMTIDYAQGYNRESISLPMHPGAVSRATDWKMEPFESSITGVKSFVRKYKSPSINDFFSRVLETPCILARIPSSEVKESNPPATMPGAFPEDTADTDAAPTSLSNESPILAINMSSVNLLNHQIKLAGGDAVSAESFRANIILGPSPGSTGEAAYMEDDWTQLQIGPSKLNVQGPCQRCHMVCIDPKTAMKRAEPYVTLSKTRRIEGNVVFGCHLALADSLATTSLKVGDKVLTKTQ